MKMRQKTNLFIRLMRDDHIHPFLKVLPILALLYLILFPDLFPGPIDDAGIMAALLGIFYVGVPSEVIEEHRLAIK